MLETTFCPEFTDDDQRCKAMAEIIERSVLDSTDGPIEHIKIRCLNGHTLLGSTAMLDIENPEVDPLDL